MTKRRYDHDGRLHVEISHISKAMVCPYRGDEIPESERLGLESGRVYRLLRDPAELQKAAPTFNNLQILLHHIPVNADQPSRNLTVGSTGTDCVFNAPYLDNSLVVWDSRAIALIESGEQKELSCGYHYRADMTPGEYEGQPYDGVMRDIRGNHVALVESGRAGNDVVVMDEALREPDAEEASVEGRENRPATDSQPETGMQKQLVRLSPRAAVVKGATAAFLLPRLAQDQKMPNLGRMLANVTNENWAKTKPRFIKRLGGVKLAQDASIEGLVQLLDALGGDDPAVDPGFAEIPGSPADPLLPEADPQGTNVDPADVGAAGTDPIEDPDRDGVIENPREKISEDDDIEGKVRELLDGKLDPEDLEMLLKLIRPDDAPPPADPDGDGIEEDPDQDGVMENPNDDDDDTARDEAPGVPQPGKGLSSVNKPAMDAAIKAASEAAVAKAVKATIDRMNARQDAERFVRPYVGEITVAMDSAEAVYKFALQRRGVDVKGVHPSAYKAILSNLPIEGASGGTPASRLAADSARSTTTKSLVERFPNAARARVVG